MEDERGRDRRDGEVEALYPQARQADHDADRGRHRAREQEVEEEGRAEPRFGKRHHVGPDTHEGALAEAHEPRIAGQDVEAGC